MYISTVVYSSNRSGSLTFVGAGGQGAQKVGLRAGATGWFVKSLNSLWTDQHKKEKGHREENSQGRQWAVKSMRAEAKW